MQAHLRTRILRLTGAAEVVRIELIQPLWNNYGTLSRVILRGGSHPSVIVKHIQIPDEGGHPRGFGGSISRARKVRSYEVETHWYQHPNQRMPEGSPSPTCLDAFADRGELFLLLEDLATRGFTEALHSTSWDEVCVVLQWLAHFHAEFLGDSAEGLWSCGTYWHLDTRPEELARIEGTRLHLFASLLDARLRGDRFLTLVHGDAKLANFLFLADRGGVAAVDFQYVGRGSAMKDVAYFVGSCLSGQECERREAELLGVYFRALEACLPPEVDAEAVETEWRWLYPVAWADFQRFMQGWSPGHRKLTDYSDATTERALTEITAELLSAAREACLTAGAFIEGHRDRPLKVGSKGFASAASDVVTEIDIQAQALILEILSPTLERYDLGVLAEEGAQDDSRLHLHAFWAIDPLDGTQFFVEGQSGYATSVALVSRSGRPILGVVYDPSRDEVFEAVAGGGVRRNGVPLRPGVNRPKGGSRTTWFADRSLQKHRDFSAYEAAFDVRFVGGAVTNGLQILAVPNSVYIKSPKASLGGCAIWDLAAVSLMLAELGGTVQVHDGGPLHLNRPESLFFNDVGLVFASADVDVDAVMTQIRALGSAAP